MFPLQNEFFSACNPDQFERQAFIFSYSPYVLNQDVSPRLYICCQQWEKIEYSVSSLQQAKQLNLISSKIILYVFIVRLNWLKTKTHRCFFFLFYHKQTRLSFTIPHNLQISRSKALASLPWCRTVDCNRKLFTRKTVFMHCTFVPTKHVNTLWPFSLLSFYFKYLFKCHAHHNQYMEITATIFHLKVSFNIFNRNVDYSWLFLTCCFEEKSLFFVQLGTIVRKSISISQ